MRSARAGIGLLAAVYGLAMATPSGAASDGGQAIRFAPPVGQPIEIDIESVRDGLRGEPVTFRSRYALTIAAAGRGMVADLTLRSATSSVAGGDALFGAILGPLIDRPARFLIGDAGRTITMLDADAYWAAFAAPPSGPTDDPAAAARAAIAKAAGGAEGRERMLSSPLQALFLLSGRSDMADQPDFRLVSRDDERIVWEQVARTPAGDALVLTTVSRWTIDARTGLTTAQDQVTHRGGIDGPVVARQTMTVRGVSKP